MPTVWLLLFAFLLIWTAPAYGWKAGALGVHIPFLGSNFSIPLFPPTNKSQSRSSVVDTLLCPLTQELPCEPVMAEDGWVYERKAIEEYFTNSDSIIISPRTNETMGKELGAAPQHTEIIKALIDNGVIRGHLAEKWKAKVYPEEANEMGQAGWQEYEWQIRFQAAKEKANKWYEKANQAVNELGSAAVNITGEMADKFKAAMANDAEDESQEKIFTENLCLFQEAHQGNVDAMEQLAFGYFSGTHGFPQNVELAYEWFEKSKGKSTFGLAMVGYLLFQGRGVERNQELGLEHLATAADKGSAWAALSLGLCFAQGWNGIPVDKDKAIYCLRRSLSDEYCPDKRFTNKEQATVKLFELVEGHSFFPGDYNQVCWVYD